MPATVVLLPGLDGTGRLFRWFITSAPPGVDVTPVVLPPEALQYSELAERIGQHLAPHSQVILVAESYSGPLAARLAALYPITALVFCNSFVAAPRHRVLALFALPLLFKVGLPTPILRRYLVGPDASPEVMNDVRKAVKSVPTAVLASRVVQVLTADETASFARCRAPVLYLRGTTDRLVPDASYLRMTEVRPVTLARVAGPHLLLQVNPRGAWAALSRFISSLGDIPIAVEN